MNRSTAKWIGDTIQCRHCYERINQAASTRLAVVSPCIACYGSTNLGTSAEDHALFASRRSRPGRGIQLSFFKSLRPVVSSAALIPFLYPTENQVDQATIFRRLS